MSNTNDVSVDIHTTFTAWSVIPLKDEMLNVGVAVLLLLFFYFISLCCHLHYHHSIPLLYTALLHLSRQLEVQALRRNN